MIRRVGDEQADLLDAYWGAIVSNRNAFSPTGLDREYAQVTARLVAVLSPPEPNHVFVERLRTHLAEGRTEVTNEFPRIPSLVGRWLRARAIAAGLAFLLGLSLLSVGVYAAASLILPSTPPPASLEELRIVGQGVDKSPGSVGREVGYGFILQNPNVDEAVAGGTYAVTAYELRGEVIGRSSGKLPIILPDQRFGIGGYLAINSEHAVDRIHIEISTGNLVATEGQLPLNTDDVLYETEPEARVTGIVINPYDVEVSEVSVWAIAYGSDGRIVGGGMSTIETMPGRAEQPIRVAITSTETPSRVELYAAMAD